MRKRRIGTVFLTVVAFVLSASCSHSTKDGADRSAAVSQAATTSAPPTTTTAPPTVTSATPKACAAPTTGTPPQGGPEVNPPGDIPDNQAFVEYTPPSGGYSIKVPEGWARRDTADGVTFTDKFNSVRVVLVPATAEPTVASAQTSEVPAIQAAVPCYGAGKVTTVTRKAGRAVLITYGADAAPDPVTGKVIREDVERYEFWRAGTEAVVTLAGPRGSDNVDPWKLITDSFTWR